MSGVCLGVDVGKVRVGVARSDFHRMLATPLETIARDQSGGGDDISRILELATEYDAVEIIVGLPLNMRGEKTPSTEDAEKFAASLVERASQRQVPLSVRMVDERLSTVSAQAQLHSVGKNTKKSRAVIDQAAAVVILQHALDSDKAQGRNVGTVIEPSN